MSSIYTVKSGDTLGRIAKRHYGDAALFRLIVQANAIANPDRLKVGQKLTIPDRNAPDPAAQPAPTPPPPAPVSPAAAPPSPPAPAANPLDGLNERRLALLHPVLAEKGRQLLAQCAAEGLVLLVTQTLRTYEEQEALYAKGRTKKPIGQAHVVTNARGGFSWHNFGLAFDVAVLDSSGKMNWDYQHPGWARTGVIGKSLGLDWGGDWTRLKDYPHFEYTADLSLKNCRNMYSGGLQEIWSNVT